MARQFEYKIADDPLLLFRPLQNDRVIIPKTQLTVSIIQWIVFYLGLGNRVCSDSDIDSKAIWNTSFPLQPDLVISTL